jgi:hypothetical protein
LLNEPFFTIEPELEGQDDIEAQRRCAVCGTTWIHGPGRVPFRIIIWRSGKQVGDLCEACLRGGSHAALDRVIERIQTEKEIIAGLNAMVRALAGVAPAEWNTAIREWDDQQKAWLNKS